MMRSINRRQALGISFVIICKFGLELGPHSGLVLGLVPVLELVRTPVWQTQIIMHCHSLCIMNSATNS